MMNDAIPLVKNVVQWCRNWSRHFSSCGATGLLCFAHFASAIEPAASVSLTVISAQQGRSELDVTEAALIEKLAAVLPDPINRDHFNHSDIELRLNGVRVGGYELVVSDTNLVQDGRFELDEQHSSWRGMNREGYSLKVMPEKPGMAFIAECAKVQNIRLAQPMTLVKDQLYLLTYSAFSDVQRGDVAVQLDDPAKSVYPTLSNSYRPMMHRQREWERRSVVFRADIEKPELRVGTAFVGRAAVADVSLRAARWRLVADLAKGRHELTLTYVPRMGRRLTPPPNEPAADAKLPIALTRIGKAELLHANDTGVALHTPSGDAWTLPSDWPLRTDRLASSRPTKPAARHEVTIAKGMDATVLLALDFGGKTIALESITSELPIKISALRLASIPTHSYGSFDETIYRQLDPMVPVNDALVPFDHDQPTVLALTIQCTASTPSGTHEGDATLHFKGFDLNVPLSVRVLPVTVDAIKHFSTVFGMHPPSYAAQKQGSITEKGISIAVFHGYDPTKHKPLIQLSRDYVQRLLDFHVQSQSPTAETGFTYQIKDVRDVAPKLTAWDFTEYDRSLENFFAHGGHDLFIARTNGDVMQRLSLANGHTYSFKPAPANAPRWHQLADDEYWNLVGRYIEGITAHLAEKGWLHRPCILVDETDPDNYAKQRRLVNFNHSLMRRSSIPRNGA